jgi:hypothetical protein
MTWKLYVRIHLNFLPFMEKTNINSFSINTLEHQPQSLSAKPQFPLIDLLDSTIKGSGEFHRPFPWRFHLHFSSPWRLASARI